MTKKKKIMAYKEMFSKWWFWTPTLISVLFSLKSEIQTYGNLFASEFIGIAIGTIVGWGILFSIGWVIYWGIKRISRK